METDTYHNRKLKPSAPQNHYKQNEVRKVWGKVYLKNVFQTNNSYLWIKSYYKVIRRKHFIRKLDQNYEEIRNING